MLERFVIAGCLAIISATAAHATNGPAFTTVGSKGPVSLPIYGDGQSAFRMPSGIGFARGHELSVDLFMAYIHTEFRNLFNDYDSTSISPPAGTIGVVFAPGRPDRDADEEAWKGYDPANKWTYHIGLYPELAAGGATDIFSSAFPDGTTTETSVLFVTAAFSAAYTPTEWLSLGAAVHFTYASASFDTLSSGSGNTTLNGSPQISGVPVPGNPSYADFLEIFSSGNATDPTTRIIADLTGYQVSGVLSFSLRPTQYFGFGFSYKPRAFAPDFKDKGKVDATRTFQQALATLGGLEQLFLDTLPDRGQNGFITEYDVTVSGVRIPRQIRGSVAFWPIPELLLSFEVAWVEWHRAVRKVIIEAENGTNNDVNFVVGAPNTTTSLDIRLSNQWIFSFYTAYAVSDKLSLRAGVNYGQTPFSANRSGNSPNAALIDLNLSAGAGYQLFDNLEINTLVEYGVRREVSSDGSPDSLSAKFTDYVAEQAFFHLGFAYRF